MNVGSLKKMADRLIKDNGNTGVLISYTKGAYNPDTGDYELIPTEYPEKISIQALKSNEIIEGVTTFEDIKGLISGSIPVDKTWNVDYGGHIWRIIHIEKITAKDINALTTIFLRR